LLLMMITSTTVQLIMTVQQLFGKDQHSLLGKILTIFSDKYLYE